jgi:membrane protein
MPQRTSLWKLGGLTPWQLIKRVGHEFSHDDLNGRAAELSYYFLLALFPLLLFLLAVFGIFAHAGSELRAQLMGHLARVLPASANDLIGRTLNEVSAATGAGKISFGILATLWAASNGMGAIVKSLNICYDVKETRPWWKARLVAIALTIGISLLVIAALALVLYGGPIGEGIAAKVGLGGIFTSVWNLLQIPLAIAFMVFAFAAVYYFAPNVEHPTWYWITPGSVVGVLLWLAGSSLFRLYLSYFDNYSKTYGSLGAVIVLILWLYVTGLAIMLGGEVNSEIEHAAAERGRPDAKLPGEIAPGEPAPRDKAA